MRRAKEQSLGNIKSKSKLSMMERVIASSQTIAEEFMCIVCLDLVN